MYESCPWWITPSGMICIVVALVSICWCVLFEVPAEAGETVEYLAWLLLMGWAVCCTPSQRQRKQLRKHIINTMWACIYVHDYIYLKECIPPVKRGVTNFQHFLCSKVVQNFGIFFRFPFGNTVHPIDILFYLDILLVGIIPCCIFGIY